LNGELARLRAAHVLGRAILCCARGRLAFSVGDERWFLVGDID
jgi:hypothetical protein